jgi:hypothetical protein
VLEAVFILLESLSPLRRIFIGSHSLPLLWFAVSVLHHAHHLLLLLLLLMKQQNLLPQIEVLNTIMPKQVHLGLIPL